MSKHMPKPTDPMSKTYAWAVLYGAFAGGRDKPDSERLRRALKALGVKAETEEGRYVMYLAGYGECPEFKD